MGVRRVARCSSLVEHGLMPAVLGSGVGYAFLVSVLTNLLFGPQMMAFHRWEDNLILRRRGYAGIQRAWWTLIWFWIPAHTVTFSLPKDLQIGLSAAGSRKSQAAPAKARTAP